MALDESYRDYFIRNLHDALSGHTSSSVEEAVKSVESLPVYFCFTYKYLHMHIMYLYNMLVRGNNVLSKEFSHPEIINTYTLKKHRYSLRLPKFFYCQYFMPNPSHLTVNFHWSYFHLVFSVQLFKLLPF